MSDGLCVEDKGVTVGQKHTRTNRRASLALPSLAIPLALSVLFDKTVVMLRDFNQSARQPSMRIRSLARNLLHFLTLSAVAGIVAIVFPSTLSAAPSHLQLKSPSSVLTVDVTVGDDGVATYSVSRGTSTVLLPSRLGLGPDRISGFTVTSSVQSHHKEDWKPLYGERNTMPDIYNGLNLNLKQSNGGALTIEFRAYDEGIALRYGTPVALLVDRELTEFHWPANTSAFEEHGGTEGEYFHTEVSKIAPQCQTPLTVTLADGTYAAVLEAANVDFPQMTIGAEDGHPDTLIAGLGGPGSLAAGSFTPWRLIMVAKTPGELLEHNYLQLDLNERQAITDTAWIKPGTAMREVTLSTEGAHKTIDFAATHGIQYVGFDDGWYGSEDPVKGDATHERTHDNRGNPTPPLDIQEAVRYGKAHGIGVITYVDRRQAMSQREILFPLYEKWGVAGLKIGFVVVGKQENTEWLTQTIREAAAHHLMLDIHDQYRTTGYTRTYPNLLTVEGIRGNEHFPTAEHDATLPFTRYLAGSADYTICYYDKRLKNTHAHQMAMAIASYSPMQWLFWYDKPEYAHGEPELKWFDHLPTVWDETHVPLGEIGKYAVLARRSGNNWYVGAVGDSNENKLSLPLTFLKPGVTYDATIYTDDPVVQTATHVAIAHRTVTRADTLDLALMSRGGEAIYLSPVSARK